MPRSCSPCTDHVVEPQHHQRWVWELGANFLRQRQCGSNTGCTVSQSLSSQLLLSQKSVRLHSLPRAQFFIYQPPNSFIHVGFIKHIHFFFLQHSCILSSLLIHYFLHAAILSNQLIWFPRLRFICSHEVLSVWTLSHRIDPSVSLKLWFWQSRFRAVECPPTECTVLAIECGLSAIHTSAELYYGLPDGISKLCHWMSILMASSENSMLYEMCIDCRRK